METGHAIWIKGQHKTGNEKGQAGERQSRSWKWRTIRYGFHVPPLRMMDVAVYSTDGIIVNFHGEKNNRGSPALFVNLSDIKIVISFVRLFRRRTRQIYGTVLNNPSSEKMQNVFTEHVHRLFEIPIELFLIFLSVIWFFNLKNERILQIKRVFMENSIFRNGTWTIWFCFIPRTFYNSTNIFFPRVHFASIDKI